MTTYFLKMKVSTKKSITHTVNAKDINALRKKIVTGKSPYSFDNIHKFGVDVYKDNGNPENHLGDVLVGVRYGKETWQWHSSKTHLISHISKTTGKTY